MADSLNDLALEFTGRGIYAIASSREVADLFSQKALEKVREKASGRPGPEIVTGEYLNSIHAEVWTDEFGSGFDITSDAPQSMRLELGFVGKDSLGRDYNQPPFPHFRPAADELESDWEEAVAAMMDLDSRGPGGLV